MSGHMQNGETGSSERLETVQEAIRSLGSKMSGKLKAHEEHLQRVEESLQKKMTQVEQSVASLKKESKGKPTCTMNVLDTMPTKKTIRYLFTAKGAVSLRHLVSPAEEMGGAKWSIYVSPVRLFGNPLSINLRCYFQDEVVSHDTSFTISLRGADQDYSKEFTHRFQKTSEKYDQYGYKGIMTYGELNNYQHTGRSFVAEVDLTILLNNFIKYPQKVVEEFCSPDSFPSDCVLILDGKRIHVNRGLLSVHSKVFNTLFNGNFAEKDRSEIPMEDLDAGELCQLLQVIYPNKYQENITAGNVGCVLKMADRFDVGAVLDKCEQFLLDSPFCFTNAKKMFIAQEYGFTKLLALCISQYISVEHLKN